MAARAVHQGPGCVCPIPTPLLARLPVSPQGPEAVQRCVGRHSPRPQGGLGAGCGGLAPLSALPTGSRHLCPAHCPGGLPITPTPQPPSVLHRPARPSRAWTPGTSCTPRILWSAAGSRGTGSGPAGPSAGSLRDTAGGCSGWCHGAPWTRDAVQSARSSGFSHPPFPGTSRPRALRDVCCIRSSTPRPATLCDRATAGPPQGGGCLTPSMPHHPGSLRHEAMSESPWPPATTDIGAGVQDASPGGVQAAPLPTGAWPAGLWCPSSYSQMGLGVPSSTFAPQGP